MGLPISHLIYARPNNRPSDVYPAEERGRLFSVINRQAPAKNAVVSMESNEAGLKSAVPKDSVRPDHREGGCNYREEIQCNSSHEVSTAQFAR